jgi:hypothetical protein
MWGETESLGTLAINGPNVPGPDKDDDSRALIECLAENLSQCHSVHHNSQKDCAGIEHRILN